MSKIAFSEHEKRFIRTQVEAGNYDDESDVVSAGLHILEELEQSRERWLSEKIPTRFDELQQDPGSAVLLEQAFASVEERHRARLAKKK